MISAKKIFCRNFKTGLDVAKLREDPELRPGRSEIPDEQGQTRTKVGAAFCSTANDEFYAGMNRYVRGRMQTYAV